jgi:hypothetical protein
VVSFANGTYNKVTGIANNTIKAWPIFVEKFTGLHKAGTKQPLFYLNVFFGVFIVLCCFFFLDVFTKDRPFP